MQQGARELLWDRRYAARERFEHAKALSALLDERTRRLLRHTLAQYAAAATEHSLPPVLERLTPELAAMASPAEARAFAASLEATKPLDSLISRFRKALP